MEALGGSFGRQPLEYVAIVLFLLLTTLSVAVSSHSTSEDAATTSATMKEVEESSSSQVLFQIPENPKAVLFIAPGCFKEASYFFSDLPDCAVCKGLPEERTLVLKALSRGYAVIAISSKRQCLNPVAYSKEVSSILHSWISTKDLEGLPIAALGIASGGDLAFNLAFSFPFRALVVMLSEGNLESLRSGESFPPTLFVHMPKDEERSLAIRKTIGSLQSKGIDSEVIQCKEMPLHPRFFSERISGLHGEISEKIYEVLRDSGWLDKQSYLKRNPLSMNWQMAVKKRQVLPSGEPGKVKWEDDIQEELNLAYGYHEISSVPAETIFAWVDSKIFKLIQTE